MDLLVRTVEAFPEDHPEAYIGNGIVGYRVKPNPFATWKAVASGYVREEDGGRYEVLAYAPYPLAMGFRMGNAPSTMERLDEVNVLRQSMDMSCGELTTEMEFPLGGGMARATVLQFVSRSCPVIACQEVRLVVPEDGELEVTASIGVGPGNQVSGLTPSANEGITDLMLGFAPDRPRSTCGVSVKMDFGGAEVERQGFGENDPQTARRFRVQAKAGQELAIRTLAATVTSIYHPEPDLESCRLVNWAQWLGFDGLRSANREAWDEIWKSRVKVTGDDKAQDYLDCSLYYLFSSAHAGCRTSIAPFGLSQAANYGGHVFWDTDTYMTPVLALVSPEAAKMTVDYRMRNLEPARQRAQSYGYAGAMYPWESDTRGYESTPSACATGWLEQHIDMCVAAAAWWYQQAAGDAEYAEQVTWPIVKAVAEWVASRVAKTDRGYELRAIMSADEGGGGVSNSSYVNALAAEALRIGVRCARLVGRAAPAVWAEVAEAMYIPMGRATPESGVDGEIILVHDEGWPEKATVDSFMIGFPFDLPFDRDLLRRTYEFYMTMDAPVLSMGHCFFAAEAAFVGHRKGARHLFHRVVNETQEPVWGMGVEYTHAQPPCFVTTMGGMLQTAMMAFTGLRFEPGNWTKYDACLPEGWESIEIDRIHLGGRAYSLRAEHGRKAILTEENR